MRVDKAAMICPGN
jgi:hypothetical protein